MRWLICYIRSLFCKHIFEYHEQNYIIESAYSHDIIKNDIKVSALCTKCGYHKAYWKFKS